MLKQKERLNRSDFNRFFSIGARSHTPHFTLVFSKTPTFHASVVVPKKVERTAVGRNRLRRQLYDILRRWKSKEGVTGTYILIMKPTTSPLPYKSLRSELLDLIKNKRKSP